MCWKLWPLMDYRKFTISLDFCKSSLILTWVFTDKAVLLLQDIFVLIFLASSSRDSGLDQDEPESQPIITK